MSALRRVGTEPARSGSHWSRRAASTATLPTAGPPESSSQVSSLRLASAAATLAAMRVLLVEDEVGLADAIARGLGAEGFEVEAVHDGLEGLARAREHRYAAIDPRHHAAGHERLPGVPRPCAPRATGRRSSCSPPRTASGTRPRRSTPAPTTSSRSRSPSWCWSPACAPCCAAAPGPVPRCSRSATSTSIRPTTSATEARSRSSSRRASSPCSSTSCATTTGVSARRRSSTRCGAPTSDADPNVVEVYVGYLRKKVDAPFDRHSLVTVRGAGYRIVDDA